MSHAKLVADLFLLFELSPMNKFLVVISLYSLLLTLGQGFAISFLAHLSERLMGELIIYQ